MKMISEKEFAKIDKYFLEERHMGIEIPCSRCGDLIDIWDWKKGDPVPKEVICETCLTHKEHAALDWD